MRDRRAILRSLAVLPALGIPAAAAACPHVGTDPIFAAIKRLAPLHKQYDAVEAHLWEVQERLGIGTPGTVEVDVLGRKVGSVGKVAAYKEIMLLCHDTAIELYGPEPFRSRTELESVFDNASDELAGKQKANYDRFISYQEHPDYKEAQKRLGEIQAAYWPVFDAFMETVPTTMEGVLTFVRAAVEFGRVDLDDDDVPQPLSQLVLTLSKALQVAGVPHAS